jgi:hypothetical protein
MLLIAFFYINAFANPTRRLEQDNPVIVPEVSSAPIFDGVGNDVCWQNVPWQTIDQVWIPYGDNVSSNDYSGRYKVTWSGTENVLYFLVEITDDVFVDGYVYGVTADVYNFDVVEVFIDEDKSGGLHVFDGTGSTGQQWGTNAENAFAYHIYADFPEEGQIATDFRVNDQDGTDWSNIITPNYAAHFPHFALRKSQNTAVWEFSLIVYDDTYEEDNVDAARVQLEVGKKIGLSLAYCDNDDPDENPKVRDNFFGSVWVPAAAYNDHWMNADYFGTIELASGNPSAVLRNGPVQSYAFSLYPNPASSFFRLEMTNDYRGDVSIRLYNLLGQEVLTGTALKTDKQLSQLIEFSNLPKGLYFIEARIGSQSFMQKMVITQ